MLLKIISISLKKIVQILGLAALPHKQQGEKMNISDKKYQTIYADPPWNEVGGGKIKRGADKHYTVMKTKDIKALPVKEIADENCWLFLWVTNNFLKDGIEVMEEWGFRYVTNFVWVKDRFGIGYYFRGQHELCLFGVKGNLKPKYRNISSVIQAKRTKHSKKPIQARDMIDKMAYNPKIELFARQRFENWDFWGNEIDENTPVQQTIFKGELF